MKASAGEERDSSLYTIPIFSFLPFFQVQKVESEQQSPLFEEEPPPSPRSSPILLTPSLKDKIWVEKEFLPPAKFQAVQVQFRELSAHGTKQDDWKTRSTTAEQEQQPQLTSDNIAPKEFYLAQEYSLYTFEKPAKTVATTSGHQLLFLIFSAQDFLQIGEEVFWEGGEPLSKVHPLYISILYLNKFLLQKRGGKAWRLHFYLPCEIPPFLSAPPPDTSDLNLFVNGTIGVRVPATVRTLKAFFLETDSRKKVIFYRSFLDVLLGMLGPLAELHRQGIYHREIHTESVYLHRWNRRQTEDDKDSTVIEYRKQCLDWLSSQELQKQKDNFFGSRFQICFGPLRRAGFDPSLYLQNAKSVSRWNPNLLLQDPVTASVLFDVEQALHTLRAIWSGIRYDRESIARGTGDAKVWVTPFTLLSSSSSSSSSFSSSSSSTSSLSFLSFSQFITQSWQEGDKYERLQKWWKAFTQLQNKNQLPMQQSHEVKVPTSRSETLFPCPPFLTSEFLEALHKTGLRAGDIWNALRNSIEKWLPTFLENLQSVSKIKKLVKSRTSLQGKPPVKAKPKSKLILLPPLLINAEMKQVAEIVQELQQQATTVPRTRTRTLTPKLQAPFEAPVATTKTTTVATITTTTVLLSSPPPILREVRNLVLSRCVKTLLLSPTQFGLTDSLIEDFRFRISQILDKLSNNAFLMQKLLGVAPTMVAFPPSLEDEGVKNTPPKKVDVLWDDVLPVDIFSLAILQNIFIEKEKILTSLDIARLYKIWSISFLLNLTYHRSKPSTKPSAAFTDVDKVIAKLLDPKVTFATLPYEEISNFVAPWSLFLIEFPPKLSDPEPTITTLDESTWIELTKSLRVSSPGSLMSFTLKLTTMLEQIATKKRTQTETETKAAAAAEKITLFISAPALSVIFEEIATPTGDVIVLAPSLRVFLETWIRKHRDRKLVILTQQTNLLNIFDSPLVPDRIRDQTSSRQKGGFFSPLQQWLKWGTYASQGTSTIKLPKEMSLTLPYHSADLTLLEFFKCIQISPSSPPAVESKGSSPLCSPSSDAKSPFHFIEINLDVFRSFWQLLEFPKNNVFVSALTLTDWVQHKLWMLVRQWRFNDQEDLQGQKLKFQEAIQSLITKADQAIKSKTPTIEEKEDLVDIKNESAAFAKFILAQKNPTSGMNESYQLLESWIKTSFDHDRPLISQIIDPKSRIYQVISESYLLHIFYYQWEILKETEVEVVEHDHDVWFVNSEFEKTQIENLLNSTTKNIILVPDRLNSLEGMQRLYQKLHEEKEVKK